MLGVRLYLQVAMGRRRLNCPCWPLACRSDAARNGYGKQIWHRLIHFPPVSFVAANGERSSKTVSYFAVRHRIIYVFLSKERPHSLCAFCIDLILPACFVLLRHVIGM